MLPRIELGLQESESCVVTMLTIAPIREHSKEEAIFRTFFGTDRDTGGRP